MNARVYQEVFAGAYLLTRCFTSYLVYYMWERCLLPCTVRLANAVRTRCGFSAYKSPGGILPRGTEVRIVDPCSPHFGRDSLVAFVHEKDAYDGYDGRDKFIVKDPSRYQVCVLPSKVYAHVNRAHLRVKCMP